MIDAVRHRGPDSNGIHCEAGVALGHARLAIVDLEHGQQPMSNEDGTVWISFNGEIFNHLELRQELEAAGHQFATRCDTEAVIHAYEQFGMDFVNRLNGQFAMALWDRRARRLVLARDRAGIRPLFYATVAGRFYFASEVKALFANPALPRRLNPRALAEVFTFWSSQPPATPFAGVSSLPEGTWLVLEDGRVRAQRYWDWSFPEETPPSEAVEIEARRLRELLIDSVRLQLRADVPVGVYLSGGLDSSILAAIVRNHTDSPLRTFSLTFEESAFDEEEHQRRLVAHLGTNHTEVRCSGAAIAAAFPRTIWHTETPILRTAPTPLLLLSEAVRAQGYKVVLTGEGADEVFGGYDLFKEAKIRRFWARQPASERRPALLQRLYPYLKPSPVCPAALSRGFFGRDLDLSGGPLFSHVPRWSTTRRMWQFLSGDVRDALGDWDPVEAYEATLPERIGYWPPLGRDQYLEAHTLLSSYLLASQGDRVAMANAVETRVPYLDHRLIEFANGLAPSLKLRGLTEKFLLRRAMQAELPAEIGRRPKQPYRAPDSPCFFPGGRELPYVAELFEADRLRRGGLFDSGAVRRLYEKCRTGRGGGFGDNTAFVGILSTLLVEELFLRRTAWSDLAGLNEVLVTPGGDN